MKSRLSIVLFMLAAAATGCDVEEKPSLEHAVAGGLPMKVSPPLLVDSSAYDEAGKHELPVQRPRELPGLHNVFRLSDRVISGSEPHGEVALRTLSEMGVKTIVSVDGKVPDAELAAKYGMRYVHVPIQYKGIRADEMKCLSKTFRELEGPFYVHCFHGKHRGPAAAAVGRVVLDGVSRETAIAEMRQWMGTSSKYEGLYAAIATAEIPDARESAEYEWDFPAAHRAKGVCGAMIQICRSYDALKALEKRGWEIDPEHPDTHPVNEAEKLAEVFAHANMLEDALSQPEDFRRWLEESASASQELLERLRKDAGREASVSFNRVDQLCSACHDAYRN